MIPEGFVDVNDTTILERRERSLKIQSDNLNDGDVVWVPLSLVHDDSEMPMSPDRARMLIAEWWLEKKGLKF